MINENLKIRVSGLVWLTLEKDAQLFGFVKNNDESNKNALLNKLIPNLLEIKKSRREKIREVLEYGFQRKDAEKVYECANMVIDEVYFHDKRVDNLANDIWIRPTRENIAVFDEIEDVELPLAATDMSAYIRSLLNEYALFPQYKRQELIFKKEFDIIETACIQENILSFRYEGEKYKVYAGYFLYQYVTEQRNYLVAYDIDKKEISCFFVDKMQSLYMTKKKFKPNQRIYEALRHFCESQDCDEYTILSIGEDSDEDSEQ